MNRSSSGFIENSIPNPGASSFLGSLLRAPAFEDTAKNRTASLQHKILLAMIFSGTLAIIALLLTWSDQTSYNIGKTLFGVLTLGFAFIWMRSGHIEHVSWIVIGVVYLIFIMNIFSTFYNFTNAILLIIVIVLAGLLLRPIKVGIVSAIATLTPMVLHFIAPSIPKSQNELVFIPLMVGLVGLLLTVAAKSLAQSFAEVDQSKQDIILANGKLQDLTVQLATHTETLTNEVENRKKIEQEILRRNHLLKAAAEIAYASTRTFDLDVLLSTSVKLIRERFDFYHISLFLIDPGSNIAILRASSGEIGHELKINEHQLVVGSKSLIGLATSTREPAIVQEVTKDPMHLKNPMLPDTRAEAVIPLMIGDAVVGALDVQSKTAGVFSNWDITTLTTIANQFAIAVQNIRLYTIAQQEVVERRRAEQALQFTKEALEIEVNARTAELSQANEQLKSELLERKNAEEKLVYNVLHDPLTNLPNRVLFMNRLQNAMERAKRHRDYKFAVLYLDLDRFKVVNDSLGHNIGDLLLIESAKRIAVCLRGEDTVARLGGDEFVILLEDVKDPMDATRVADRIQDDLALPCDLNGHKVFVSVSIGIILSEARYEQPGDILRDADIAMYRAKGQGRGRYEMFHAAMLAHAKTRLKLESELRKALERQEFIIHYQPIIELGTSQIVGFEALARWQHPTRGLVAPAEFIPTAEETGLIVPIGHWVLAEACRQICEWQIQFPSDLPLTISVNLSVRQCAQMDLVQKVAEVLQKTGLGAGNLKLELTESMIVEDTQSTAAMLSELRALGVQVQIDDFGTGYSSLGYLQRLPIDTLKIDRTFVSRIKKDGSGSEIVRTILALAHDMGMKVIAEGVETEEQLLKLKSMDCEYGQGFLFTKPLDSRMAGALLAKSFAVVDEGSNE